MNTPLTYNKKAFLLPDSIRSAAMYHAKVFEDGTYMLRIHDCITGIRLRGDLNNNEEREEAILKLFALEEAIHEMRKFLETNYKPL